MLTVESRGSPVRLGSYTVRFGSSVETGRFRKVGSSRFTSKRRDFFRTKLSYKRLFVEGFLESTFMVRGLWERKQTSGTFIFSIF